MILLSPIGITPKENDYKYSIRGVKDVYYTLLAKFGWKFELTYKSPLRTVCSCCKDGILKGSFSEIEIKE